MSGIDPLLSSLAMSSAGMETQSIRLRVATENLSNVDTPGYQRKLITFQDTRNGVELGGVSLDQSERKTIYNPSHPLAQGDGTVVMSNVDMMIEMADAREAGRGYDANLQVFSQARQLYENLWGILKR